MPAAGREDSLAIGARVAGAGILSVTRAIQENIWRLRCSQIVGEKFTATARPTIGCNPVQGCRNGRNSRPGRKDYKSVAGIGPRMDGA
jgi:hypothetical protein